MQAPNTVACKIKNGCIEQIQPFFVIRLIVNRERLKKITVITSHLQNNNVGLTRMALFYEIIALIL